MNIKLKPGYCHFLITLILFTTYTFSVRAQSQKEYPPRSYVAYYTFSTLNIDGLDKEEAWQYAPWTDDFIDIEGTKIPKYKTRMKILWDQEYLYLFVWLEEPHVWATLKKKDTVIFYNNDFELFIDPDGDSHNYLELEINALNTIWDLLLIKPYRNGGPSITDWDIPDLKSAVQVNGTLNNPKDIDENWQVELAIPWKALIRFNSHRRIPENETWRLNFSRVAWEHEVIEGRYYRKKDAQGKYLKEENWVWSPQWVINMHEPEKWGYVYFSENPPNVPIGYQIPADEKVKWFMYELYRKQKQYFQQNKVWATDINEIIKDLKSTGITEFNPQFEMHKSGWNIFVESLHTGVTYVLKEDGQMQEIKKPK